jgi:hypothetical protein
VKSLYYIIPIGAALLFLSTKLMATTTALKNLSIKLTKFKFNFSDSLKSIFQGNLTFDISFDLTNLESTAVNINSLFLNLFVDTAKVATLNLNGFKLNANGKTPLSSKITVSITALPAIIKSIYNQLKTDLQTASYLSIPGKVLTAITAIQNEVTVIKSKLYIKGTVNIEGINMVVNQKLS